ncbi:hypothetical protein [Bartonella bovis]|uniref:Uncharacterized protein n=1 Tax=Bartonella bovis 91-4 TaxID=1094491 RepID=N6UIW1_9HYPH|nr:hypothetical protein [Bartonella bovis]ENN90188.1 hypothetical protein BBbe_10980 [Bartonella bovis 91-4]
MQKSKRYHKLFKIQSFMKAYHKIELEGLNNQLSACEEETRTLFSLMEKEGAPDFWDASFLARRLQCIAKTEKQLRGQIVQKKQIVHEASSRLQRLEEKCKEVQVIEERQQFSNMLEDYVADKMVKDVSLT